MVQGQVVSGTFDCRLLAKEGLLGLVDLLELVHNSAALSHRIELLLVAPVGR
jgi:hypothetical protein